MVVVGTATSAARRCLADMRRAVVLSSLVAVLGAAEAAPRRRSRFAAYIDPALVERHPRTSPPVSVEFVLGCTSASSNWLAAVRQRLTGVLGKRVVASIGMTVVVDCASGNDAPRESLEPEPCDASLVAITPATPNGLVIDFRCRAPTTEEMAALIRSRLGPRRR
jgi:hypothetical protein